MESIRIKNLRSLTDTGFVRLAPVTLLVGENSSGKSTFLRFFPFLRQSVEASTTGPFLWYGEYVDFGSFGEALNRGAEQEVIGFAAKFIMGKEDQEYTGAFRTTRWYRRDAIAGPVDIQVELAVAQQKREAPSLPRYLDLRFADHEFQLQFSSSGAVEGFTINGDDVLELDPTSTLAVIPRGGIIPNVIWRRSRDDATATTAVAQRRRYGRESGAWDALIRRLTPFFHGNTNPQTIRMIARKLPIGSSDDILRGLQESKGGGATWQKKAGRLTSRSVQYRKIETALLAAHAPNIFEMVDDYLTDFSTNVAYLAPLRATAERYYRIQGLSVREVDYEGRNLAMFIRGLTDAERKSFQDWLHHSFGFIVHARLQPAICTSLFRKEKRVRSLISQT